MRLQAPSLNWAARLFRGERDPRRAERVFRAYDEGRHYSAYLARCREQFRRPEIAPDVNLQERGFAYLRALEHGQAVELAGELHRHHEPELLKKGSRDLEGFRISDLRWLEKWLALVLRGPVDEAIAGFFRAEYLVHWVAFALTRPAAQQDSVSFLWHCDKGPTAHLKLIIYLNPTAAHGGNTEFIDLGDTSAVARAGYVFGWTRTRTGSVERLSRLAGRPLGTHCRDRDAGEAVLFQPSRVLHRGISPTRGRRLTATLCLLPSPAGWRQALHCETLSDLAVDEKWHGDALRFLAAMQHRLHPNESSRR